MPLLPKELVIVAHSRRLMADADAAEWFAKRLASVADRRATRSVLLLAHGDRIHPILASHRHDDIVQFHDDGHRWENGRRTSRRWSETCPDTLHSAVFAAATSADLAGWHLRWIILMHSDDDANEPCREICPQIPLGYRDAYVDTYSPPRSHDETRKVVWLDTETTGLDPAKYVLIEVAAIVTDATSREVRTTFERKIKPPNGHVPDPRALEVNGYTPEKWADADDARTVLTQLLLWLPPKFTLAGHNVAFDHKFLTTHLARLGLGEPGWRKDRIDTRYLAQRVLKATGRIGACGLDALRTYYGLSHEGAHTAMSDAEAARQVYLRLVSDGTDEPKTTTDR